MHPKNFTTFHFFVIRIISAVEQVNLRINLFVDTFIDGWTGTLAPTWIFRLHGPLSKKKSISAYVKEN